MHIVTRTLIVLISLLFYPISLLSQNKDLRLLGDSREWELCIQPSVISSRLNPGEISGFDYQGVPGQTLSKYSAAIINNNTCDSTKPECAVFQGNNNISTYATHVNISGNDVLMLYINNFPYKYQFDRTHQHWKRAILWCSWIWQLNTGLTTINDDMKILLDHLLNYAPIGYVNTNKILVNDEAPIYYVDKYRAKWDWENARWTDEGLYGIFDETDFLYINMLLKHNNLATENYIDSIYKTDPAYKYRIYYLETYDLFYGQEWIYTLYPINLDGIHFGEAGIIYWGNLIANKLVEVGWYNADCTTAAVNFQLPDPGTWTSNWYIPLGQHVNMELYFYITDSVPIVEVNGATFVKTVSDNVKQYSIIIDLNTIEDGSSGSIPITATDSCGNTKSFNFTYMGKGSENGIACDKFCVPVSRQWINYSFE